jgi:hypothetical protein
MEAKLIYTGYHAKALRRNLRSLLDKDWRLCDFGWNISLAYFAATTFLNIFRYQ